MKKYFNVILTLTFCIVLAKGSYAQELKTEYIMEMNLSLNPPVVVGSRVLYSWSEGTIIGEINGKILPVGAEFGTVMNATTYKLDVRAVIQTNDSAIIYITYSGYIFTDAETFKLLASGKGAEVNPSKYYYRSNPMFETTSPKYEWLNHIVAIGVGSFTKTGVSYKIYAIK